jgi:formylglycine-generating enzyme
MDEEAAFLENLRENPDAPEARLIFADWLQERGDPRHEMLRLTLELTSAVRQADRAMLETRLRDLTRQGIRPVGPFFTNSIGMEFVWIPAGRFRMGSPRSQQGRDQDETLHTVVFPRGFYMSIHLVTQKHWVRVMKNNPSHFREGEDLPVEWISWLDCQRFCRRLKKIDGNEYRLPTEAEWEYSCRAGSSTAFHFGDDIGFDDANYESSYSYRKTREHPPRNRTTPVGSFRPNAFGLYDCHGNLQEFCQDWYGPYPIRRVIDPKGPESGENRMIRGGSWGAHPARCRCAEREWMRSDDRSQFVGFRICFTPNPTAEAQRTSEPTEEDLSEPESE